MRSLMVQGTSSWAGKSLLTTALCRLIARRGVSVAPFKGVNMSNNARVVDGGEIGVAQYLQAIACGVEPDVRMNPVLVKPEAETRSQVVLLGRPDHALSRAPWQDRAPHLRPAVDDAAQSLHDEFDLIVAEGAGSPAEINLYEIDLANMHVARLLDAAVLLVTDINRGGAFAHLHGTWSLLPEPDRERVAGFVLNRFRGDAALLSPAPELLQQLTGVPTIGTIPWLEHGLPDEDGAAPPRPPAGDPADAPSVAIVRYPAASNLDEFKPLERVSRLTWVERPDDAAAADLLILPGSKHVAADLEWLRTRRLDYAIARRIASGAKVLAICGGLQMLGGSVEDPDGVEGAAAGLGFLPLTTTLGSEKTTTRRETRFADAIDDPWQALAGLPARGYEIRHGRTALSAAAEQQPGLATAVLPDNLGFASGPLLGVYLHGLFEDSVFTRACIGVPVTAETAPALDAVIDELADRVEPHLDMRFVEALAGMR